MHITIGADHGGQVELSAAGDLDLAAAGDLESAAEHVMLNDSCKRLVVDLSAVTFIDSTGIGALVSIRNSALSKGIELTLRRPSAQVYRLIEIANLAAIFDISDGQISDG